MKYVYRVRKSLSWICLALCLSAVDSSASGFSIRAVGLSMGQYDVGFVNLYRLDEGRAWVPFPAKEGEQITGDERRPIRISIWYPAMATNNVKMVYREYVTPKSSDPYFQRLNDVISRYDMWSYGTMFNGNEDVVERLMNARTNAIYAARPADTGPFPVVIYSAGWYSRSPDNTVLAEYLASHGFVFVTVPQLGEGVVNYDFRVTPKRLETQIADLRFALKEALKQPYADPGKIVAAGYSIGGIAALLMQQRDDAIDGVVGLDGSFMSEKWTALTETAPGFDVAKSDVPILSFVRGNSRLQEGLSLKVLESLVRADRTYVRVAAATHGEFSNEPAIFAGIRQPWAHTDYNDLEDAFSGHMAVIEYTRRFMESIYECKRRVRPRTANCGTAGGWLPPSLAGMLSVKRMPAESE